MGESDRYALVVSSSQYAHPSLRPLAAPAEDADALQELLRDSAVGAFRVRPVIDQPSWVVAQEVETFFSGRRLNDLALFYFSGHGIKDEDGALYFATMNTNPEALLATTVSSAHVIASMRKCRSRRQVLIIDCCYAGAFSKAMLGKGAGRVGIQERFATEGSGRVVIAASDAMQIALDGTEIQGETTLSAFTQILVDGIREGHADQDGDGHISLDELYDYVYTRMQTEHPDQTPTISNLDKKGDIVIAFNPKVPVHPPIVDDEPETIEGAEPEVEAELKSPEPDESDGGDDDGDDQPPKEGLETELSPGLREKLTQKARTHPRLTIGLGVGVLAAAIVAVVLGVVGGGSNDEWALTDVDPAALDGRLADIAALPNGFSAVAVGRSRDRKPEVWTYDGTTWSRQPQGEVDPGSGRMHAVGAYRGAVVAVGNIDQSKGNTDAMAWRRTPDNQWVRSCPLTDCGGTGRQEMFAVAPIAGGLVAVGRDARAGNFDAAVWRSLDDGTSWQRIAANDPNLVGPANQVMSGVVEYGDLIVAVGWNGRNGAIWTSANSGDDWERVASSAVFSTSGHPVQMLAVATMTAANGPRLIVVGRESGPGGYRAAAWFSDDGAGEIWSRATVDHARFSGQQMVDLVLGQKGLIAVGNASGSRAGVWQARDGTDWTEVSSSSFSAPSGMTGIAQVGGTYVVGTAIWENDSDA